MASPRDLLAQAKAQIKEVGPRRRRRPLLGQVTLLDVREPDENEQGAIPGSIHLPRGQLEFQVEGQDPRQRVADHRLLRRRRPFGIRCPDDAGTRLQGRGLDGRRLQPLEGRGPPVGDARRPSRQTSGTATSATSCCPRSATPDS